MSYNTNNESELLKVYLKKLSKTPLFTKIEEKNITKKLDEENENILNILSNHSFFTKSLLNLLSKKKEEDLFRYCKYIDGDSSEEDVVKYTELLNKLKTALETDTLVKVSLKNFGVSTTLINNVLIEVKAYKNRLILAREELVRIREFFQEVKSESLLVICSSLKEDKDYRSYMSQKLNVPESKLMKGVFDLDRVLEELKKLSFLVKEGLLEVIDTLTLAEKKVADIKDQLIVRNLRLVISRAKIFMNRGIDMEDLVNEGNIGLIRAINKFDTSRKAKIATYATWWVDQAIRRAISNKSRTVRIPTHVEVVNSKLNSARAKLLHTKSAYPTVEDLHKETGIPKELIARLLNSPNKKTGLEDETEDGFTLIETLPDDSEKDVFEQVAEKELQEKVRKVLTFLTPKQQIIVRLRFGIGEKEEPHTLQQIADKMGISKQGVKSLEGAALIKMRAKKKLLESIEDFNE